MSKELVTRKYYCQICKTRHSIEFPSDFADDKSHYLFAYFYIHKYIGHDEKNIEKIGADIITTLYIDKNLVIRGSDVVLQDHEANIISKDDSQTMITILTEHINELQVAYDNLSEKYTALLESTNKKR